MTRTRLRPSLRLLVALAVWAAIVTTTFVCARFSERLTSANVVTTMFRDQQRLGAEQLDAWAAAKPRTVAGLVKALAPDPVPAGEEVVREVGDPWIWEVSANLTVLDTTKLGTPVYAKGPRPPVCMLSTGFADGALGSMPDSSPGTGCAPSDSDDEALAMSTLPTGHGTVLVVAQAVDVHDDHFQLDYQRAETRRLAIIVGLVGALGAWLLAGAVTRPIERLRGAVDRFGDGDLAARATVDGPSEVAGLAGGFNAMAGRVEHTLDVQRRFVADTSHELRTPAAAMLAATQALDLDAPHDEALDLLVPQAERLATLTDDLLVLNRFDEGRQRLDARPVDLADVVCEAVQQVAVGRDVRVEGKLDGDVVVDPARVMVVVRNLVANALQHGAEPAVVALAHEDGVVTIQVSDAGPGVPESLRENVFVRFVRGDDSRHGGGRGLGLALARENARLHGGDVALADDGRTFVVTLPVTSGPEPSSPVPEPVEGSSVVTLVPGLVEGTSPRRGGRRADLLHDALPLALCEGAMLLVGILVDSGRLYLANDSHFFHRPTWQWLPVLVVGWALAALLPTALDAGVRRVLRGRTGRVLGALLAAALLVGAAIGTLFAQLGEDPLTAALGLGGIVWLLWRTVAALARRGRRRR